MLQASEDVNHTGQDVTEETSRDVRLDVAPDAMAESGRQRGADQFVETAATEMHAALSPGIKVDQHESAPKPDIPKPKTSKKGPRQMPEHKPLSAKELLKQWVPADSTFFSFATKEVQLIEGVVRTQVVDGTLAIPQ